VDLAGKKIIAIGEREGVTGPSLELMAQAAGAQVILSFTQCFV
jgi:betaine reductase